MVELCIESYGISVREAPPKQRRFIVGFYRILSLKYINPGRPGFKIMLQCIQRTLSGIG